MGEGRTDLVYGEFLVHRYLLFHHHINFIAKKEYNVNHLIGVAGVVTDGGDLLVLFYKARTEPIAVAIGVQEDRGVTVLLEIGHPILEIGVVRDLVFYSKIL